MFHFTFLQAGITGLIQGITELFPISSLGHAVLVPAWLGGSWREFSNTPQYLLIAVAFHLASAVALFIVFAPRWIAILRSVISWKKGSANFKLFWLLVLGTLPVGLIGVAFNNFFQRNFQKPLAAAIFLAINGLILLSTERLTSRRHAHTVPADQNLAIIERVSPGQALVIGVGQSAALFAGISRFGITVSAGMLRGLSRSVAADFAFLLSFPVILGASIVKLPKLGHGALAGSYGALTFGAAVAFVATIFSVKVLTRWFKSNSLRPFAAYCLVVGLISIIKFGFIN
ncbi:MAG: undecaprenyl-diphosphate phosphatase [Actinomycetes bacterium]